MANKNIMLEKWKRYTQQTSNTAPSTSTLVESKQALNHKFYGIFLESNKYYIKESKVKGVGNTPDDFEYIGGAPNKHYEKFNSIQEALRRLNYKIYSINEALDFMPEEEGNEEDRLFDKLDQKNQEQDAAEAPMDDAPMGDAPMNDAPMGDAPMGDAPMNDAPADDSPMGDAPMGDAPMGDAPMNDAPADDSPMGDFDFNAAAPQETTTADPIDKELNAIASDAEAQAPEGQAPEGQAPEGQAPEGQAPEGQAPEGQEGEDDGDNYNDLMSELGRLGNEIDKVPDLSAQLTKTILNTLITKTKGGIEKMDDNDKETLAKRIEKDGRKIEEDDSAIPMEGTFPVEDEFTDVATSTGGLLPTTIQENKTALERTISKLVTEAIQRKKSL